MNTKPKPSQTFTDSQFMKEHEKRVFVKEIITAIKPECSILGTGVIAAFRLPLPVSRVSQALDGWPKGSTCTQVGQWLLIHEPKNP